MRAVTYSRFSTDLQSRASITDQQRICHERAEASGWQIVADYADEGISGASILLRHGIKALMAAAQRGEFDVVISESLDRLSRDQEDIAGLFKRLSFRGVAIFTLSEGMISELHIGLTGTMSALYLKNLADKTRRGLRGRIENGKSGGGVAFGYKVVREIGADGKPVTGERTIDPEQAAVVRRIFREFAEGRSPREIAIRLNMESVKPPRGESWAMSAIYGDTKRGVGILANTLYVGLLTWNRCRFLKDPSTGRRVARLNPRSEWIVKEVPELRIVPDDLWERVQARRQDQHAGSGKIRAALQAKKHPGRGPAYLFSSLLKCSVCGSNYIMANRKAYICSTHRNRGPSVCSNGILVSRKIVEDRLLDAIKNDLFTEEGLAEIKARHRERLAERRGRKVPADDHKAALAKVETAIANIVAAIRERKAPPSALVDELERLEASKVALERQAKVKPEPLENLEALLSRALDSYGDLVKDLERKVSRDMSVARNAISGLVGGSIELQPTREGGLDALVQGDYAGLVALAGGSTNRNPLLRLVDNLGCGDRI